MQPYQLRVIQEKTELDIKIKALAAFTKQESFEAAVPMPEQRRMFRQLVAMQEYSQILGERIAAFGGTHG